MPATLRTPNPLSADHHRRRGVPFGRTGNERLVADTNEGAHGVHGTQRDDSKMQEEPAESGQVDMETWAEKTETGGEATD